MPGGLVNLAVDTDANRVIARFDQFPMRLQQALVARLRPVEQRLLSRVQAATPRRTGKLVSEIRAFLDTGPDWVRVRVRVVIDKNAGRSRRGNYDAGKAAALEYGARNTAQVMAFRRMRGESVKAYQRRVNIAAVRFLHGPFDDTKREAEDAITKAVADAIKAGG